MRSICNKLCSLFSKNGLNLRYYTALSTERYPDIKRGAYKNLQDKDIDIFEQILPFAGGVIKDVGEIEGYNRDWLGIYRGQSQLVLRPKTTKEVSEILKYCNDSHIAVCPQGGNTGLVGGSVPLFDEVVLSTQLMKEIINIDETSGVIMSQAGCVLEALDDKLRDHDLMMPLDLGAKGSCQIGGNLATNAGGMRLLRYGSLQGSVLGLEAVLADGQILDCMSSLRKDNTGYSLKHLFVGSEGTLGVITKAAILCPPRPKSVNVAFLGCDNFDKVLALLQLAKQNLGEIISAFEFLDHEAMQCNNEQLKLHNPISDCPFYVLVETSGSNLKHDQEKLEQFVEKALGEEQAIDGTMANEPSKIYALWQIRERLAEALVHDGFCYKYDVSLPLHSYYSLVGAVRSRLEGLATRVVGYGHVGDGNLHLNATSPTFDPKVLQKLEPFVFDFTAEQAGSVSAEHGLGLCKSKYIFHSKSKEAVAMMIKMKQLLDPNMILNPYKTLPLY